MKEEPNKSDRLKRIKGNLIIALVASLTLGLAPFVPEPHLFGKWRWLLGGAEGMQAMDWFDLILHSAPWIYLIIALGQWIRLRKKRDKL